MLRSLVTTSNRNTRQPPKLILDPNQSSFAFALPGEVNGPVPPQLVAADSAGQIGAAQNAKAPAPDKRRSGPQRARISFEAPVRLKNKLTRVARELDRSKTALLREAVERHLRQVEQEEIAP
jgi:hypothetical protein